MKKITITVLAMLIAVYGYSQDLPLTAGSGNPLTGDLYFSGNRTIYWDNNNYIGTAPSTGNQVFSATNHIFNGALSGISATFNASGLGSWYGSAGYAWFGHKDHNSGSSYGFLQSPAGETFLNSTNQLYLRTGGQDRLTLTPSVATLSVPLTGTSATFNGSIETSNGLGNYVQLGGTGTSTSYLKAFETHFTAGNVYSGGSLGLVAGNAERITIASNGNTTFSGAINLNKQGTVKGLNLAEYDTYASMRVIGNAESSGVNADGMYIGYANGNNGITRLFGGGSSTSSITLNGTNVSVLNPLTGTTATFSGALSATSGHFTTSSTYNNESTAGLYVNSTGLTGSVRTIIGADNISGFSYIAGLRQGETWAGKLFLQPNGGTIELGGALTGTSATFANHVAIGTPQTDANLSVKGKIRAKEIKVELDVLPPDYVFEKEYDLKSLPEVEKYITENKHLPEIPSAKTMTSDGVNVGEMQMKLLQKIEELTLHLIEQDKKLKKQEQLIDLLIKKQ